MILFTQQGKRTASTLSKVISQTHQKPAPASPKSNKLHPRKHLPGYLHPRQHLPGLLSAQSLSSLRRARVPYLSPSPAPVSPTERLQEMSASQSSGAVHVLTQRPSAQLLRDTTVALCISEELKADVSGLESQNRQAEKPVQPHPLHFQTVLS